MNQIPQFVQQMAALDGQMIITAADGQYLGILSSDLQHPESVLNFNCSYGCPYGMTSTQNPNSVYGGANGIYSPYNPNSIQPPQLLINGQAVIVATMNQNLQSQLPKVDLSLLLGVLLGARYGAGNSYSQSPQMQLLQMEMEDMARARRDAAWLVSQSYRYY